MLKLHRSLRSEFEATQPWRERRGDDEGERERERERDRRKRRMQNVRAERRRRKGTERRGEI